MWHATRLVFQLAEFAVPKEVFRQVLERFDGLHPAPGYPISLRSSEEKRANQGEVRAWGVRGSADVVTATSCWCRFATYAMKTAFLLNHRYAPYHKWLYREFLKLPDIAHEVDSLLKQGFESTIARSPLVAQIESIYAKALDQLGYQPSLGAPDRRIKAYSSTFGDYARAVHESIRTPEIAAINRHIEVCSPSWKETWMYVRGTT